MTNLILGSPEWTAAALGAAGLGAASLAWGYARARAPGKVRLAAAVLKGIGLAALALALVEPLLTGNRPRSGANAFAVVADDSQSLKVRDDPTGPTRGDWARDRLKKDRPWMTRLAQDFDVRRYAFDSHLRAVEGFDALTFEGPSSSLAGSVNALGRRFRGLNLAGVLLFTDGNRTDLGDVDPALLPPIYPVIPPSRGTVKDVGVANVAVTQANFEAAPVVLRADVLAPGFEGKPIVAVVLDEAGRVVERQEAEAPRDGRPVGFRFQFRPETKGLGFFKVAAFAASAEKPDAKGTLDESKAEEQTLANNARLVVVDQGGGPYRVLYISGRPNWEYKFLRRALADDDQLRMVGLIRIAKRVARFDFQASGTRTASPLFNGFDNPDADTAERADQPVLVRLDTLDESELRDGFPKAAEELYRYHAIILDDLEAGFFSPDQMALVREFVARRGGGLMMLGGPDSFADGRYDKTPIGDLLPVYLDRAASTVLPPDEGVDYRPALTREGWLQPWVRGRKTEDEEKKRLDALPAARVLSRVGGIKPGASVLAEAIDPIGNAAPALVAQPFGKGRVAALTIGDLWRRGLRRDDPSDDDLGRSWRQAVRWLVADVPGRVELATRAKPDSSPPAVELTARVRDAEYRPLDNAKVALRVTLPDGSGLDLDAEPDGREAGSYSATYVPKLAGPYRAVATATAPDGSSVGTREAGWASQPSADEFARLEPDRDYLRALAARTGGEVVDGDRLDAFVASLASRDAPIVEPWTAPIWHHPLYFLIAVACLAAEWALRRTNGLA